MSWAALREVTRGEDAAYSLMGIFDVNMPLLYGEGRKKAFRRLQLEIVKQTPDESILAWEGTDNENLFLAQSPANFVNSGKIEKFRDGYWLGFARSHNIQETALGYTLDANLIDRNSTVYVPPNLLNLDTWTTNFAMPLACESGESGRTVFIQLHPIAQREYYRAGPLFYQELDWGELLKHLVDERIFVRSFRLGFWADGCYET